MTDGSVAAQARRVSVGLAEDGFTRAKAPSKAPRGRQRGARPWHQMSKRGLDVTLALTMLLILLPLMLTIALIVCSDGKGAMFSHARVGRGGRSFGCLKFRSMVPDADRALAELLLQDAEAAEMWRTARKLPRDPRVTPIGRLLRASSLDELPQLINVLRGEMSLVGPRPVVQQELAEHYGPAATAYLAMRPGITGLWQVSGRSDTSYAERVALDQRYVEGFSFWGDLVILARTVPAVLCRRGAC